MAGGTALRRGHGFTGRWPLKSIFTWPFPLLYLLAAPARADGGRSRCGFFWGCALACLALALPAGLSVFMPRKDRTYVATDTRMSTPFCSAALLAVYGNPMLDAPAISLSAGLKTVWLPLALAASVAELSR